MYADKDILDQRISNRIDHMIYDKEGLVEAFEVFQAFEVSGLELDFEKGILQAIGYKEFYDSYLYMKDKYGEQALEILKKK